MPDAKCRVLWYCGTGLILCAIACGRISKTTGLDDYVVEETTVKTPAGTAHVQVLVPAGKFVMGSVEGGADELPVHEVAVDAFYIDKYEVTNAQFSAYVKAKNADASQFVRERDYNQPDQPVVGVFWNQARDYCQWAGMQLPTEAQWEKAARGTDERTYPWGNEVPEAKYTNFNFNQGLAEVGHFPMGISPYGALDMAGNAWEWTLDEYEFAYYAHSPKTNPVNLEKSGLDDGPDRTLRGGAWISSVQDVRIAERSSINLLQEMAQQKGIEPPIIYASIGFRCARVVPVNKN